MHIEKKVHKAAAIFSDSPVYCLHHHSVPSGFWQNKPSDHEKYVFRLSRNRRLSPSELIRDMETQKIILPSASPDYQQTVITAIANLYLKRLIIFDCL